MKNESEQSNAAVCEGKWGRMSSMMVSSSAAEFMCLCRRRLWMADAWGILSRVTWANASSFAVGVCNRPVRGGGVYVGCGGPGVARVLRLRFFDGAAAVCICFGGRLSATFRRCLRLYSFSCVTLALCVSFVPHLFHASNLSSTLLRVSSHAFVLLCSVSSVSTSTAALRLGAVRSRCVASCCILSMSGVSFRCSHTE
jgi:hypothetical protein